MLDFGCGAGELTVEIARGVRAVRGIDTSGGMLERARARAAVHGVANIEFAQSALFDDQERAGQFTAVTVFNVLHYLDDIGEASRRISELLVPGGVFISATACLAERRTVLGAAARVLSSLRIMPRTRFFKEAELADLIAHSGFQIVQTERLSDLPDCFIVAKKSDAAVEG